MPTLRSVRVVANTDSKVLRTVNVYDGPTGPAGQFETCLQLGPTGATGEIETVQGLTGPTAGVKNVIIEGYAGPV